MCGPTFSRFSNCVTSKLKKGLCRDSFKSSILSMAHPIFPGWPCPSAAWVSISLPCFLGSPALLTHFCMRPSPIMSASEPASLPLLFVLLARASSHLPLYPRALPRTQPSSAPPHTGFLNSACGSVYHRRSSSGLCMHVPSWSTL